MFQSTRPQGARHRDTRPFPTRPCFNPRARKGRDGWRGAVHGPGRVSIHAPARGATVAEFALAIVSLFQSTRPQGARLLDEMDIAIEQLFQSTRPQGARPEATTRPPSSASFNPRARKGRDPLCMLTLHDGSMFQSTRPQGARRPCSCPPRRAPNVSIHAPARGATYALGGTTELWLFQSTRPQGARLSRCHDSPDTGVFQSTRPQGARH